LELTAQKLDASPFSYMLAYVLSRHHGNYVGLYDQDASVGVPHGGSNFMNPAELQNAEGLLPNDRTHVFKAFGAYRLGSRLTAGSYVTLQSGTPLSYLGANATSPFDFIFLRRPGTSGRTPWIWDLNVHLGYDLRSSGAPLSSKIVLDAFHLFSGKRPVWIAQKAYLAIDPVTGEQTQPNPLYGQALLRQPPMTLRLGLKIQP
jgi:hypothetical protein